MEITFDGRQIKTLRLERRMSMQDLHDLTGISIIRIAQIEKRNNPSPRELSKIVDALQERDNKKCL